MTNTNNPMMNPRLMSNDVAGIAGGSWAGLVIGQDRLVSLSLKPWRKIK